MKILLVEDNPTIAKNIKNYLSLEHMEVDVALTGTAGWEKARKGDYDVILLDIMLPEISGIEICRRIRQQSDVPIIMLTAKGELEDKITGFDVGADDYLVKPFELAELVARIKAIMKRNNQFDTFVFKDIEICLETRKVTKSKKEVPLTIKEFYILEILLKNYGIPVSRADIIEYVWGSDAMYQENDKLDVYIANLRKKLDKNLIQTIKGYGYKISKK